MQLFANNAETTLAASILAANTVLSVAPGDGAKFPNPQGGDYFLVTLCQRVGAQESNWEVLKVTARNGDSMTVQRAYEGTALPHGAGEIVSLRLTAKSMHTDALAEHAGAKNQFFTGSRVLATKTIGVASNPARGDLNDDDSLSDSLAKLQGQVKASATEAYIFFVGA